ncbi:MAG: alpha/beta fold hydrolase, partial [Brevundimonas sp.]
LVKETGGPVVLVGHSIGGMTIQTLARDYPEMLGREVVGLVLINTTHINPLRTIILSPFFQAIRLPVLTPLMMAAIVLQPLVWLSAWQSYLSGMAHVANRFGFGRFVARSQLDHTTLLMTRNPPGVQARGNLAMFGWDATAALPTIGLPVLVLGGDMDIVTKLEASRTIADAIPHARLQVVEGVNHMGFLERADIYNTAVADFVNQLQVGAPPPGKGAA